jgi:ubiquinone/menaquinone biosynthesis C-methylase UbiE
MPVHFDLPAEGMIYQRAQYNKGGMGRRYWDYRDRVVLSNVLDKDRKILDIGCGEGITLEKVAQMPTRKLTLGIDLSEENVTICSSFGLPVIYGSAYCLPFRENYFDVCLMLESVEHMDQPTQAIMEAHRVLKPGGKLVVVTPHDRNFLVSRLMTLKVKEAFYDPGHLKVWHPKELKKLFADCGFSVICQRNIPFFFWQTSLHHIIVGQKLH